MCASFGRHDLDLRADAAQRLQPHRRVVGCIDEAAACLAEHPCVVADGLATGEHHPERDATVHLQRRVAHGQARIVGSHRGTTGHDRRTARTQALHVATGGFGGDPLAVAVGERRPAVEACCDLEPDERRAAPEPRVKTGILRLARHAEASAGHVDAGGGQCRRTGAIDAGVGIGSPVDDPRHTGGDQRLDTRRRASVVGTGLERDVGGRAAGSRSGRLQCAHLGVRFARALVPALTDRLATTDQDAADAGVGIGRIQATPRQFEGPRHEGVVGRRKAHFLPATGAVPASRNDSWPTSRCTPRPSRSLSISSWNSSTS